jgi:hypothetical protein
VEGFRGELNSIAERCRHDQRLRQARTCSCSNMRRRTRCKHAGGHQDVSLHHHTVARQEQRGSCRPPLNMTLHVRVVCEDEVGVQAAGGSGRALGGGLPVVENLGEVTK